MPLLQGKNLILRALEPEDLQNLYRWENNPDIWYLGETHKPFSHDTLKRYLETAHHDIFEARQIRFGIQKQVGEKNLIGLIDLFAYHPLHQRAGVGILIGESHERKQGYAYEALQLLLNYAFSILFLHQVYAGIPAGNDASIKLFTKIGFKSYGHRPDWIKTPNGWEDELLFQLSAKSWESSSE